jgi:hypothetical protein
VTTRFERALADLVGGYDGGFVLWLVAMMRLDLVAQDSRDVDRFRSYPEGALNRLLVGVDDALHTCELAVDLERMIQDNGDGASLDDRKRDVADVLLARARELADARLMMTPDEWAAFSPRNRRR